MNNNIIAVKNISLAYERLEVLKDISFSIKKGDYIGLVGHNGSGKTTLIKALLGLLSLKKGSILLFNQPLQKFNNWNKIGYLPQNLSVINPIFPASVYEIVALGLLSTKFFPKQFSKADDQKIDSMLNELKITDIKNKMLYELSGGQLQRVMLARTLITKPELLILDEPANTIDAQTRRNFFSYVSDLNKKYKTTVILITHDLGCVGQYANKIIYLEKSVLFYGTFKDFCQSTKLKDIFGDESKHIICHQH